MQKLIIVAVCLMICSQLLHAQVTGFVEDFNDNLLTAWEFNAITFELTETDGLLKIDYHRTPDSWEWHNFNFTPPLIDASDFPFISVRVKSNISTVLAFKPIYENGNDEWLPKQLPGDNQWHDYLFQLSAAAETPMNRIYMYLDGGSMTPATGTINFDELRIGDAVRIDTDRTPLLQAIQEATALHDNGTEGNEEGQFANGSKGVLRQAIDDAQNILSADSLTFTDVEDAVVVLYDACMTFESGVVVKNIRVVDPLATKETCYLFSNLVLLSKKNILFGHQDDTAYGIGWWDEDARSDVYDVCGSYPAVYGWDLGKQEMSQKNNLDGVEFERIRFWIRAAYERGGINTISWHSTNPFSGGSSWDVTPAVSSILPGGIHHEKFKSWLDRLAIFFKSLRSSQGKSIPVIFRPFHEHTGSWFWWGSGNCTTDEYNQIWQFTVKYLTEEKNVHNLLFAISPNIFRDTNEYLARYPGDEFVDVLGVDDYTNYYSGSYSNGFRMLRMLAEMADERNKIAALTEVGFNLNVANCWTQFLKAIKNDTTARQISYMLFWRNASKEHYFAPYPGQLTAADFVGFYDDPVTLFEDNLPDVYQLNTDDHTPPVFVNRPAKSFTAYSDSVTLKVTTNERAFVRYSVKDQSYDEMTFEFQKGQGGTKQSTLLIGEQGQMFTLFIRALDHFGNAMDTSAVVSFQIDTLLRPVNWRESLYDDSQWRTGRSPLGYGAGEAATTIDRTRTAYFRRLFQVSDPGIMSYLAAIIRYDNGAVIYLNGHEVERINMPSGDIDYSSWAFDASSGYKAVTFDAADRTYLKTGENLLAVEMHQNLADSADLNFDLRLIDPTALIEFGSEWSYFDGSHVPEEQTIETAVEADDARLAAFHISQNYPNPFNASTAISYQVMCPGLVRIIIYDLLGQCVRTLVDEKKSAGSFTTHFDASDLASGIYLCQMKTGDFIQTHKMVLMK